MKQIYTARDGLDANFLAGLLEQEGIRATVQGEALQETWGGLNLSKASLPTIWVDDADVSRAVPVVEEYKRRDAKDADQPEDAAVATRPTWRCGNCGRAVEEQFTSCW